MTTGPQKRTRSERVAALELPPARWERALASLGRRDVLLRIGLCVLTALVLCALIRGWDPPMAYRTGYTPSHDIVSNSFFKKPDPVATEAAWERTRSQVRYVYARHPEPLVQLVASLRNTVLQIASAETYADVDPQLWAEFQPPVDENAPAADKAKLNQHEQEQFQEFHQAVTGEENLARFEKAVTDALAPFERRGLLDKPIQKLGQGNQEEIVVYPVGQPQSQEVVRLSDVLIGDAAAIRKSLTVEFKSAAIADRVFAWLRPRLPATLLLDEGETQKALQKAVASVEKVYVSYTPGQTLAKCGEPLQDEQIDLLRREYRAAMDQRGLGPRVSRAAAIVAVVLTLFGLCGIYLQTRERRLLVSLKRLTVILVLAVLTVALACWASRDAWRAEIVPLLLFSQVVAIAYRQELAFLLSGVVSLIVVLALGLGLSELLVLMGVTAAAILQLGYVRSRSKLIYVGFFAGLAASVITIGVALIDNQPMGWTMLTDALRNALWTLAAGFLMTGLLPFIEPLFGVLTDISLLELGDVAHPLLQELVRRAPSTYNHSITVGSIAEAAAESSGGRGLLVRVGAYFHDIGKMLKPGYFIENQGDQSNRHEDLVPAMSTLVIIAHIKDGANLARQHHLPQPIIDFIQQHHGTTLVEFFYERASEQSESNPDGGGVEESTFRYPGPKPQTKEAGVLMLADAVESASRTLVDPTPARIESLVREMSERRLDDGQFDESGLTLRELRTVENSIIKSITAIYHSRVKYHDQRTA